MKVSIIVPVYNVESYLDKCLNSLVNQTLKDIVTSSKNQELINNWIKKKQQETYILISPEYKGCQFHYPGWKK